MSAIVRIVKTRFALILLSIAHGSVDFYVNLLQALAPAMAVHLDVPLGGIVALVGIGQFATNVVQPLAGLIMGRRNLSWIVWAGAALSVLPAFMGWVSGFWPLAALILIGAVGTGIFHPEGLLAAHDASGEEAHFGVPLFMAGGFFLSAVAAPVGIQWVERLGFKSMAVLAIPGLLIACSLLGAHRKRKREHPSIVVRPRSRRVARIEAGRLSFWPIFAMAACFSIATGLFFAILTSHYELKFGSEARAWAGWVILAMGGVGSLSSFFWGYVCRKKGYFAAVFLTMLAAAPLFFLLANAGSPAMGLAIAFPLSLIAPGALYPTSVNLSRNSAGLTQSLRAGLMVGGTWGAAAVVTVAVGVLIDRGVDTTYLVAVSACACLLAGLIAGGYELALRKQRTGA
ncbi:MAG: MFS transporter [Planctomycetota bacterium]|nr:MFS transporter [Planctomycetota bacterium]